MTIQTALLIFVIIVSPDQLYMLKHIMLIFILVKVKRQDNFSEMFLITNTIHTYRTRQARQVHVPASSHHPQEVLLAQFSLYVHKGGLKPDSFHFFCSG